MPKDIRFLLVILLVALSILIWLQNQNCNAVPNSGALQQNIQTNNSMRPRTNTNKQMNNLMTSTQNMGNQMRASRESQKVTSKLVDSILKGEQNMNLNKDMGSMGSMGSKGSMGSMGSMGPNNTGRFTNPIIEDVNNDRNSMSSSQSALEALIKDVNVGNTLLVNSPNADIYRDKAKSIDAAPPGTYRKVSYKDSKYRYDFDNDGSPSQSSQDELNSLYDDALIFKNNEYLNNNDYTGFTEGGATGFGSANLKDFTPQGKQTQQEKIMSLYNSNEYLPNNDLLDSRISKGFQILENPVSVSNPSLIPVLKAIPVSSILGSKRNSTWDIRAEPPCPKTVVSPFLNSSIMPDIYATQRGCL